MPPPEWPRRRAAQAPQKFLKNRWWSATAGLLPENTLAAFKAACKLGVDAVELDVLVSADGELVVHHDFKLKPEIARTADGAWIPSGSQPAIKDLTLAQLKTYDIGRLQPKTSYAARYPEQNPVYGERIPTFKEVIDLFKQSCSTTTRLFVEIKTSPEEPTLTAPPEVVSDKVVQMLKNEGIVERTWILSFDWCNLPDDLKKLIEMKVDAITTNRPDVLQRLLDGR